MIVKVIQPGTENHGFYRIEENGVWMRVPCIPEIIDSWSDRELGIATRPSIGSPILYFEGRQYNPAYGPLKMEDYR